MACTFGDGGAAGISGGLIPASSSFGGAEFAAVVALPVPPVLGLCA
jgi:hypothetical protein